MVEDKSPEEVEKLVGELKDASFGVLNVITSVHEWLNLYFWPENESKSITINQLKSEIAELEKEWGIALLEIEELKEIPAVAAFIGDVNKAFAEVRRASLINQKSLEIAHNIIHDIESIWWGTDPPPYGATETEMILADKSWSIDAERYRYDEQTGRYINEATGIWYVVKDGYKIIPPEQYFDPEKTPSGVNITDRPDDVWELKEIRNIAIEKGDALSQIITQFSINHFRMNRDWYSKQVLELNNITDPHFIRAGDTLKIPIYIDSGSKN